MRSRIGFTPITSQNFLAYIIGENEQDVGAVIFLSEQQRGEEEKKECPKDDWKSFHFGKIVDLRLDLLSQTILPQ